MPEVSVRTAWEVLLPPGTQLLGGEAGLDRPVTWPVVLRTHPPAFDPLRGGELAIIPLDRLHLLDSSLTLARVVTQLARMRIGGVCAIGPVGEDAVGAATTSGVPLFKLPDGAGAAEVHGSFMRALAEHRLELSNRIGQIGRELNALAIEGRGRSAIVRRVGQLGDSVAALADEDEQLDLVYVPPDLQLTREEAVRLVAEAQASAPRNGEGAASSAVARVTLAGASALVAPLRGPARAASRLILVAIAREVSSLDAAIVEQGVAACSIDLAREEAAVAARDELHGDFLDDLLGGSFPSDEAIERRGRNFGHDLARPHLVVALQLDGRSGAEAPRGPRPLDAGAVRDAPHDTPSFRAERGMAASAVTALSDSLADALAQLPGLVPPVAVRQRAEALLILAPLENETASVGDDAKALAACIAEAVGGSRSAGATSIGIGGVATGGRAIAEAAERASQALTIGVRLFGPASVTAFEDLGLYQLLFGLRDLSSVVDFHRRMLGALIEHDRRTGGELLRTLDAYLSVGCSPTAAAERLHLHRNGLLYRLQRIREIVPVDLDDPERRLALHLALRVGDVLEPASGQIQRIA